MVVSIKLFAGAREIVGRSDVDVEIADQATVAALRTALAAAAPKLAPLLARSLIALNADYARDDDLIRAGDKAALIPPVSGG